MVKQIKCTLWKCLMCKKKYETIEQAYHCQNQHASARPDEYFFIGYHCEKCNKLFKDELDARLCEKIHK